MRSEQTAGREVRFLTRQWGPIIGPVHYEFLDHGKVIEMGVVASPQIVEQRFASFMALRPWEPVNGT